MSVTFLFGSGADTDACSSLKSGADFAKALIQDSYGKECNSMLGQDQTRFQLIYPASKKVFLQTICTYEEKAKKNIGEENVEICKKYYCEHDNGVKDDVTKLCRDWYDIVKPKNKSETKNEKIQKFFLENAVFFDSLDEKFNALRFPEERADAKRVMRAYATVFVYMLKCLYEFEDGFDWTFDNIFNVLREPYPQIQNANEKDTYYAALSEQEFDYHVVTTNYTESCKQSISKRNTDKEPIYLHGKLTWFEDLQDLTVYDVAIDADLQSLENAIKHEHTILPFIMIPSGVKPIICKKQIREFSKFIECLDDSNLLVVIGYRFNSEDNHINSIIADWLRQEGKQMVYFNYNDDIDFSKIKWAENLIREESKIKNISISKVDAEEKFKSLLDEIEQNKNLIYATE